MGHLSGKDLYRKLGKKIDGLAIRAPWNKKLYAVLKELYTPEEAEVIVNMPYKLSNIDRIVKNVRFEKPHLQKLLDSLSSKGLLMDLNIRGEYYYMISPMIIGIFEYTMMRTGENLNSKEWARLLNDYMEGDDSFFRSNFGKGQQFSPMRAIPHEETLKDEFVEILDYEKASYIIDRAKKYAVGICSCRHEKHHLGQKECDIPLEKCSSYGRAADFLVSHDMAKEVSKEEMLDNLEHSKENKLVLCADNVKQNISFMCQCCDCCCNVLLGISKFGFPNVVVSSSFIAESDGDSCSGCGDCAEICPVNAIKMNENDDPVVDKEFCLGCGVCALECDTGAMELVKREQRVIHPENTFERVMMQSLERGNLQNLLFDDPKSLSHKFMRGFVGGFLRLPPVKKAMMKKEFSSRFLGGKHAH
ncbi:ATP-binding protein [candidate division KSB1 bacterium]